MLKQCRFPIYLQVKQKQYLIATTVFGSWYIKEIFRQSKLESEYQDDPFGFDFQIQGNTTITA